MLARNDDIGLQALRHLQLKIGGNIVDQKLVPIGPHLSALRPTEPQSNLHRRWHVVQTEPQQEKEVAKHLDKECKLDAFCPCEPARVRVNPMKHRTVSRPMMRGYVFAGFDVICDKWEAISDLRGVVRLLMIELRPVPIPEAVIEYIRRKELELAGGRLWKGHPIALNIGAMVRILEPFAFAGLFGHTVEIDQKKQIVDVEIDIFGRKVKLSLAPEQVEMV